MKRIIVLLALFSSLLAAQGTISLVNPGTPPAGGYAPGAVVSLNIVKSGNATVTAAQFDISTTPGIASITLVASTAAVNKNLTCGTVLPFRCVIVGLNASLVPDGTLATVSATLATALGSIPSVTLAAPIEADGSGKGVAVTLGNPTITLLTKTSSCDVNGDGSVNGADLTMVSTAITQRSSSAQTDLNLDNATDVRDAQIVATAAVSPFTCNAGATTPVPPPPPPGN